MNNTKQQHPSWTNETQILAQAKLDFNTAAQQYFVGTIRTLKRLRPKARWGYYQFPYCAYNGTGCAPQMAADNDEVQWLWNEVDVLFPEIYQYTGKRPRQLDGTLPNLRLPCVEGG